MRRSLSAGRGAAKSCTVLQVLHVHRPSLLAKNALQRYTTSAEAFLAQVGMASEAWQTELARARSLGLTALKLGTEEEGLSHEEVRFLAQQVPADLGIVVKIGGPCARADLRLAAEVGATAVVAPMVESPFALRRFIEAADADLGPDGGGIERAFNLETRQAVALLPEILAIPQARRLDFVNIGRSDLAASLGLEVGDAEMNDVVVNVIQQLCAFGLPVHVGGRVTRATLLPLLERCEIAAFHTRFLAFRLQDGVDVAAAVSQALRLELVLLEMLAQRPGARAPAHRQRALETQKRLQG